MGFSMWTDPVCGSGSSVELCHWTRPDVRRSSSTPLRPRYDASTPGHPYDVTSIRLAFSSSPFGKVTVNTPSL